MHGRALVLSCNHLPELHSSSPCLRPLLCSEESVGLILPTAVQGLGLLDTGGDVLSDGWV